MESSALAKFNARVEETGYIFERGNTKIKLTGEALQELASRDINMAVEALSDMQKRGVLTLDLINKIFNVELHNSNIMSKAS